jgi:Macrocin-O-methyltransferase (TylF)
MVAWRQAAGRLRRRFAGRPPEGVKQVVQRTSPVSPIDPIVAEVREKKLTYLPVAALNDLFEAASTAERDKRPGVFIEAGCALGGSAIVLTKAKDPRRPLFVHDVFGMIPPPSDEDGVDVHERYEKIKSGRAAGIGGNPYYGYETDLIDKVRETFTTFELPVATNAVTLVKGLFQDTLTGDEPVALAHIDGDWYESVLTCLLRIGPRLTSSGVMVIDDYFYWSGCRKAVDEFLADHPGEYRTARRTRLQIEKI